MPFPASRTTAALNELYTNTFEAFDPNIIDLTAKSSPMLYAAQPDWLDFYKTKPIAHHTITPVLDTLEAESIPWDGESAVTVNATRTPRGAYWEPANYQHGAAITWREVMESRDPYEVHDILETRLYQAYKRSVETLGRDIWKGHTTNALRVLSLHEAVFPTLNVEEDGSAIDTGDAIVGQPKWTFRQTTSTYAGVARTAFTSETAGGTNWENLSVSLDPDHSTSTGVFDSTSGTLGLMYGILDYMYEMTAEGLDYPDLIVMSRRPYTDYKANLQNFIRYSRNDTEKRGVNFAIDNVMFHQAVVIVDDNCRFTYNIGDAVSTQPEAIFLLNTGGGRYLEICADPAANFSKSDFYSEADTPLNSKCLVVWRGMNRVLAPHRQCVMFNYAGT